jgi:hypothetical protein
MWVFCGRMTKVTAGVLMGILLGALHGVVSSWGEPRALDIFTMILGRASQGIVNGILAAYATPGKVPLWRGALFGGLIGVALGGISGIPSRNWDSTIPLGAAVGIGCGLATAAVKPKATSGPPAPPATPRASAGPGPSP